MATRWKVGLLLLLAATIALADVVQESYNSVNSKTAAPGYYRTGLAGADSDNYLTPINAQSSGLDTTLCVVPRLGSPGRTCAVTVALYHRTNAGTQVFLGIADVQTATAISQATDGTGYFAARPLYFPLNGAQRYDVRVVDVSAGTVDLRAWTIGATSQGAQ